MQVPLDQPFALFVLMVATNPVQVNPRAWMSHRVSKAKLVAVTFPMVLRPPSLVDLDFTVWMVLAIVYKCPQVTTPLSRGQLMHPAEHSTTCHAPSANTVRMVPIALFAPMAATHPPRDHRLARMFQMVNVVRTGLVLTLPVGLWHQSLVQ